MELTLYTHNFAQQDVLYYFSLDELNETEFLAINALKLFEKQFNRITKQDLINQLIAANFAYNENDQPLANHLIFTIASPNKLQPKDIECIVFYKEYENTIEVIDISAYFG